MAKSGIFYKISNNVKKNFNQKGMHSLAFAAIGGALYPLIPTLIQGFSGKKAPVTGQPVAYNIDMSGWKGVLTGGIATTLIGMASNKMEIAFGGFAAMVTHVTYVKANDTIASFSGSPIFAFDKTSSITGALSDTLPPGMEYITLPDGTKVLANSGISDYTNTISDYTNTIADYVPGLSDDQNYNGSMLGITQLPHGIGDFTQEPGILSDFYNEVSMGAFN